MNGSGAADRGWDLLVSPWHLDEKIEGFPVPAGAITFTGPVDPAASEVERMTRRYRDIADAVAASDRPLVLAGDCLTALGLVAGLQRRHRELSLIWLDAHGDFNTPETTISGYLAGMSLAMLTGRAPEPICERLGLRPVPDEHAVLIGARDLDPAERDALEESRVRRLAADSGAVRQSSGEIYLHVDVDIVDGEDLPGLKFPVGAGPPFALVVECLAQIVDAGPPIAASISCAWTPERIGDESTRLAITRLAAAIGAELEWPAEGAGCG